MPGGAEVAERHPGQRALADPGRAAEQDQRAGHEAAAEHPVELGDPGAQPRDRRAPRRRAAAPACPAGARAACAGPPARLGRLGLAAPRPACSTRRSRRSAPTRSAPRGRTPGRRRMSVNGRSAQPTHALRRINEREWRNRHRSGSKQSRPDRPEPGASRRSCSAVDCVSHADTIHLSSAIHRAVLKPGREGGLALGLSRRGGLAVARRLGRASSDRRRPPSWRRRRPAPWARPSSSPSACAA